MLLAFAFLLCFHVQNIVLDEKPNDQATVNLDDIDFQIAVERKKLQKLQKLSNIFSPKRFSTAIPKVTKHVIRRTFHRRSNSLEIPTAFDGDICQITHVRKLNSLDVRRGRRATVSEAHRESDTNSMNCTEQKIK